MYRPTSPVANWERLVVAATTSTRPAPPPGFRRLGSELPDSVPQSLKVQAANIDTILQVANDLEQDDPNVARILCEHAYSLSHRLDPNSEGRGVLQFKTGLMSVIKQKSFNNEDFDRSQDIGTIQKFYKAYREKHQQEEERMRFGADVDPIERTTKRKKVFTTLRVLKDVVDALAQKVPPAEAAKIITTEFKKEMESDVAQSEKFKTYNILPLDAPADTDLIVEVKAAITALEYSDSRLPRLPDDITHPTHRYMDMFDVLHYVFGFQHDNVSNQREHLVLLLANAQLQLGPVEETELQIDEDAINTLCNKILANYLKWCAYIRLRPAYHDLRVTTSKQWKLLLVSLYLLIWGEAANVRFLPECICYMFHHMAIELFKMENEICQAKSCKKGTDLSFLNQIISPVYYALKEEVDKNKGGKEAHSKWKNYDDFNELFWSPSVYNQLGWPWKIKDEGYEHPKVKYPSGKTSFVEHRTFLHLYHSFHRVWILLVMTFQALTIIAFSSKLDLQTLKIALSLVPTYFAMNLIESVLDILLMFRAYRSSRSSAVARIIVRFFFFGGCASGFFYLYLIMMHESNDTLSSSFFFKIYLWALGSYVVLQLLVSLVMHVPSLRVPAEKWEHFKIVELMNWLYQDRYFVGRGLFERVRDCIRYILFWVVVLGCKFTFSYFMQIKPLVSATREIIAAQNINYTWHDFISKHNHNALAVGFFWAPVFMIYLLDISIWYSVFSAVLGGLIGAKDRLGEIHSLEMLRNRFESFPKAFVHNLQNNGVAPVVTGPDHEARSNAEIFAPFWNEIIQCLYSEDYITNRERDFLLMPSNKGALKFVQWPLFLLVSKVSLAIDLAIEQKNISTRLWEKIKKDEYMAFAVKEAYESLRNLLTSITHTPEKEEIWVAKVFDELERTTRDGSFHENFQIDKLQTILSRITALTGLLLEDRTNEQEKGAREALQELHETVIHVFSLRKDNKLPATYGGASISWPSPEKKESLQRLHFLLLTKESAASIPKNLEARRRLEFFTNSLFMRIPKTPTVREMKSFSVYTPYCDETVLYSKNDLYEENEDGISILFYLPDEWKNFVVRINSNKDPSFEERMSTGKCEPQELQELRLWASYRGQTLARTVRGMMYYKRALMLQSHLEQMELGDIERASQTLSFEQSPHARAYTDLKFTYVVTCQIYGEQKKKSEPKAEDILYLMQRNTSLRIAFIDIIESQDGKAHEYHSKLVKADNGKDQEIYSIKLPGDPILGEGKPENQNHAIIFTRGDAIQTIDMNQDNYFEEALKMRNLLQEFREDYGFHFPTILGVREHVFTGSVSSLAWFMSNQETSFVTLGQRVLANPLKVRMHYGHPDVFDRIFHLSRGGISKASKVINISEDIFAGFNSTLRQGNITHHEYIQVGKGHDVGLNQIAKFEAKVSSGNGEQALSRDVYRLGQSFDLFRMLSFYTTSVGYYVCTMMTVLVVYVFLYGKAYLALSGVGASLEKIALITNNKALQSVLDTQFLFQIGMFTAVPMLMGFLLEEGFLKAIISFVTMQLQLCSVFFTFSLGTKTHYFGRTILHGGTKYRATGRGFVVQHIKFADNYRFYSRSHFVKALEIVMLLLVHLAYGFDNSSISYIILSFSSWFLAISWLFAPYIFNPSGFEWRKTVDDFNDWINWLLYKGGVGVKEEESWETWWEAEQEHICSSRGRILETILSLRFFIFQYGVVYHLKADQGNTDLKVYGISWLVLVGIVLIFKVFSFSQKASVHFQMLVRIIQGMVSIMIFAGLVAIVLLKVLSVGDLFASLLAVIPTGWGILSIGIAWKYLVKKLGLWNFLRAIGWSYDAAMGMVIFFPIAVLSWFPFVSTFQTRLLFNQAFSRGLEISLILAGNRLNVHA